MLKAIPEIAVKCNEPVEKIIWENNSGKDIIVRTANGTEYHSDHVIVTCSIGFLREHWEDFFHPNLPADRLALYSGIGYGSITKVNFSIFFLFLLLSKFVLFIW